MFNTENKSLDEILAVSDFKELGKCLDSLKGKENKSLLLYLQQINLMCMFDLQILKSSLFLIILTIPKIPKQLNQNLSSNLASIEDHFKTSLNNEQDEETFKIEPLEIKCKCLESFSLFFCKICFHKDSQLCLGIGSFAIVFYALWMGTPVAVKSFNRIKSNSSLELRKKKKIIESFKRELHVLKSIRHPNIIGLYGYHVEGLYLVMEVARNGCLADKISLNRNREFSTIVWPIHLKISLELVAGLFFLHERDFIHGDLKSFNILLDSNYTVKIADFGTAGINNDKPKSSPLSIAWASPQRLSGKTISKKSDIYSIGIIFWELATLELPFTNFNGTPQKLASHILHSNLRPEVKKHLNGLLGGYRVPTLYVWLMQKIWQKKESDRLNLKEISQILLKVKECWKCGQCGWFTEKQLECCEACNFNPFSSKEMKDLMAKSKVEIESLIDQEVAEKDLNEILFTPKLSKTKNSFEQSSATAVGTATGTGSGSVSDKKILKKLKVKKPPPVQFSTSEIVSRISVADLTSSCDFDKVVKNSLRTKEVQYEMIPQEIKEVVTLNKSDCNNLNKYVTFEDELLDAIVNTTDDISLGDKPKEEELYPPKIPVEDMTVANQASLEEQILPIYQRRHRKLRLQEKGDYEQENSENEQPCLVSVPNYMPQFEPKVTLGKGRSKLKPIYQSLTPSETDFEQDAERKNMLKNLTQTEINTHKNQGLTDAVKLDLIKNEKQTNDYSKYTKSCIVKDCGKCSFEAECALQTHKNLHLVNNRSLFDEDQQMLDSGLRYEDQRELFGKENDDEGNSAIPLQPFENETMWTCDLCDTDNDDSSLECTSCRAQKL